MTTDTPDDAVPAEEVRELAREWRHTLYTNEDENRTRMACADDLEALIADVEGERDE